VPNGISIRSAVFTWLTAVTDKQTDRHTIASIATEHTS